MIKPTIKASDRPEIQVTQAMLKAGSSALNSTVPMDIANPVLSDDEIVSKIYCAMDREKTRCSNERC